MDKGDSVDIFEDNGYMIIKNIISPVFSAEIQKI